MKIALVGGSPSPEDMSLNYREHGPTYYLFTGSAGSLLDNKLSRVGLARQLVHLTTLVKTGHASLSKFWSASKPKPELLAAKDALLSELCELPELNVVVCLGKDALWALTGEMQIDKWRGTVSQLELPNGRKVKVIGTYDPAAVVKQWDFGTVMEFDLKKAVDESTGNIYDAPQRNLIISPSYSDTAAYLDAATKELAYDIETSPRGIECISFSYEPEHAISVPTTPQYWESMDTLQSVLILINKHMKRPDLEKVAQNMPYDFQYMYRFWNTWTEGPWFDTMIAQHSCYSELRKGLGFLASIYSREPYYKDDLKVWMSGKSSSENLWLYNAKDSALTLEIKRVLETEMESLGARPTFDFMMELLEPLLFMMLKGMNLDKTVFDKHREVMTAELHRAEEVFQAEYPGVNPHSPKQVGVLAYETLGLPKVMKKGKVTTDKKAIAKLAKKHPVMAEVARIRTERKLISTYLDVQLDREDGRFKCSYNSTGTDTGRLSSSSSSFWCGNNAQNWPKRIRDAIIPDRPDLMFTQADLKGAEAVIVGYLSEDPIIMKLHEEGGNLHHYTATQILWPDMTIEDIKADKERYGLAKRIRHGGNYKMGWKTLAEELKCTAAEAKEYLKRFYDGSPNLKMWQNEVETKLKATRILNTPLGRKRIFFGRMGPELIKSAVAYIPQETCAHVLNLGLINVYNSICGHPDVSIIGQVHDSILLEHPISMKDEIHAQLPGLMKVPVTTRGRTFHIEIELESGMNWKELEVEE